MAKAKTEPALEQFEGNDVSRSSVKITKAGDGLSDALKVEPIVLHRGDEVYFVLRGKVRYVAFPPEKKDSVAVMRQHVIDTEDIAGARGGLVALSWEGLRPPYRTIVADPPWHYDTARITTTGKQRRAEAIGHYSTLSAVEVADLSVIDLAADDAHLYLWTTNPILPQAFSVVAAWGFRYVTMLTWRKMGTLGMGFHFRGETEHVLFGVRGELPIPPEDRVRNWFDAPRRGHSVKPAEFFDIVERVSPEPRCELFARQPRLGWDHWGFGYEGERETVG